jgi:hypothetical protein
MAWFGAVIQHHMDRRLQHLPAAWMVSSAGARHTGLPAVTSNELDVAMVAAPLGRGTAGERASVIR